MIKIDIILPQLLTQRLSLIPLFRYIFPGLGLGVTVAGCKTVTDRMLYVAAEALANFVTPGELEQGKVFPHVGNIRAVSHRVAVAVAEEAIRGGQARKLGPEQKANLPDFMARKMYYPEYVPLVEKREITI
jgi:malic enzyme